MFKIIGKISGILAVVLGVLAVVILLLVSSSFFNLIRFRYVSTGSMEPKIKVASLVLITKTDVTKLKIGDIINFLPTGSNISITHRIADITVKDNQISFTTKGDANNINDIDPVPAQNVTGKVVLSIPYLGYFYTFIKTPVGFIVAVILPALYILISEFLNIKNLIENQAIQKYKKTTLTVLILILSGILVSKTVTSTLAYFSDGKVLANNTFSTSVWALSPTPTPIDGKCKHENAECEINNCHKECCQGLICVPFNGHSGNGKCQPGPTATPTPTMTPTPSIPNNDSCRNFYHFWDNDFDFQGMKNMMMTFKLQFLSNFNHEDQSNYEFIYTSQGIQKGIAGKFTPDFDFDRNFYLGTCTTEQCNPDLDLGSTAIVNIDGHFCNSDFHWKKTIRLFR